MKLMESLQQKTHTHPGYLRAQQRGYKYAKELKPRSIRKIQFEPKNCRYENEIISCHPWKVSTKDAYVVISK